MNNPFDYLPERLCNEAISLLEERLVSLAHSKRPEDIDLCRELDGGKMLGVLIATDAAGVRHALYAFSGQIGDSGFCHPWFVEPIFDYLQPDGHFRTGEADISRQSREIAEYDSRVYAPAKERYDRLKAEGEAEVARCREAYRQARQARAARRAEGDVSDAEAAEMIHRSQFEKAELHRLKKRMDIRLAPYADKLAEVSAHLEAMKQKRRADSEVLQSWLFSNFRLLNARGESRSLSEIFAATPFKVPPSGAGECCAPKLLQAAYVRGWKPLAIAEYWHGQPKGGEVRVHGAHYPACRGKCLPVLRWMLLGLQVEPPLDSDNHSLTVSELEILFENDWFCVVNKPTGLLSVPGRTDAQSVQQLLEDKYGAESRVRVVHRLDQDTSGLIVAAFGDESYRMLQSLFASRNIRKTYVAELEGDFAQTGLREKGRIELPLAPDWLDRPRQRVDHKHGKQAVTDYEVTDTSQGRTRILFRPHTGRTHQLRVHAASAEGLGLPIAGDRLYGSSEGRIAARLMLHAWKLEFTFPTDNRRYTFEAPLPF